MLVLIHGDDTASSRKKVDEFTTSGWNVRLNGEKVTLNEMVSATENRELFADKKTIILENLFRTKGKQKELILSHLNLFLNDPVVTIVLWQDGELDKQTLKKVSVSNTFLFSFPKLYYQFLDSIRPHDGKKTYQIVAEMRKHSGVSDEQLFYSLVKRIRYLLMARAKKHEKISEFAVLPSWQQGKLVRQSEAWTEQKLVAMYHKLFELEVALKTSQLPLTLGKHIDILLLTELE